MDPSSSSIIIDSEDIKEKELLSEKVKLENGTYNYVFSRNVDDLGKSHWRCNICDVIVGGSLAKHAIGRKHQSGLSLGAHPVYLFNKSTPPAARPVLDLKLAPGEPVPPGFENEVRGITEIQASLDAYHSGPLIGLEYLIELSIYEDEREPQYVCLLCDKRGDPRTVMAHLVSFNHRMTYLQTHFPTAYRALAPYTKQFRRNCQNIVTSICEQIEKRYGRMTPQAADRETFDRTKQMYLENVSKDTHPSERMGETFEYLVDKDAIMAGPKDAIEEIKKANEEQFKGRHYRKTGSVPGSKRDPSPPVVAAPAVKKSSKPDRRSLSSISSISSSSLSSHHSRSRSRSRSRTRYMRRGPPGAHRSRSRSRSAPRRYYRRSSRSYSRSPPPKYHRREAYVPPAGPYYKGGPRMPWQRPEYGRSRIHYLDKRGDSQKPIKNDRMEDYKRQCQDIEEDMAKILEEHERNPEKHPMYPEEWKKFWNRRYKELQAENKDPTKHDFKPEWIDFWNKRMKELHDNEMKSKKDALRKRLNLPEEPQPISFKIMNKKKPTKSGSVEPSCSIQNDDVIIIDDSKDDEIIKDRKRSHSPWETDIPRDRDRQDRERENRERENRDRERERERERDRIPERDRYNNDYSRDYYKPKVYRDPPPLEREYKRKPLSPIYPEKEEEINIVAILRLLTALEEKLGSLGPKVIDLLSQALALEKAEANSAETLLDNEVNCVLFETVKEKLKGQLLAGMVEISAEKTFKNAIQKIASLLHFASERKKTKDKESAKKIQEPVKIPGIGAIDKGAIAKQIATALVAQGKTDVTQAELEQLINAVVGMAQASHQTGKPISTASFVQQISAPQPSTDISNLLQSSLLGLKSDPMSSALQLLQSSDALPSGLPTAGAMDQLSDSELKTLLQNFKDLSTDEQHSLITYLKKLEAKEPDRVERLRKFVKLGPSNTEGEKAYTSGRISPFANRETGANPSVEELDEIKKAPTPVQLKPAPEKVKIDSDEDEDYSYEDVFRAASKNVNDKQMEDRRLEESKKKENINVNLTDAKMLIANLMGQLGQKNNSGLNLLGLTSSVLKTIPSIETPPANNFKPIQTIGNQNFSNPNPNLTNLAPNTNLPYNTPANPLNSNIPNPNIPNPNMPNPNMSNPNIPNQQFPPASNQPFYQQNRQFNAGFDGNYSQNNYQNPQNFNQVNPGTDFNNFGTGAEFVNSYGQTMQNNRQPPYGRNYNNYYN